MSSAPAHSRRSATALLILDMISCFDFPGGARLVAPTQRAAEAIAVLKRRARRSGWPVIYVNDTGGVWESDQRAFIRRCSQPKARGRRIVELLAPTDRDYFIFKPRHSAFFDTPLNFLLQKLDVKRLVVTGTTAHQCVLFTAMDAHVRGYELMVPRRCIAAPKPSQTRHALAILTDSVNAKILDA